MFALVEWKDETEKESWSIVPTSHIKNFTCNDFLDGLDESSVHIIEWRGGLKKKPKGGWPLYEATVHKVAERQSTLEKLQHERTQHQSSSKPLTKRKCKTNPKFVEEETSDHGPSSPKKRQTDGNLDREILEKIKLHHGPRLSSATNSVASPTSPSSALPHSPPPVSNCPPASPSAPPASSSPGSLSLTSPSPDPRSIVAQLKAENEALKIELENIKTNVVSQMPKLLMTMGKLEKWLDEKEQTPQELLSPSSIQETLEIHPGSGVYVPKNVLWSASHANTPTTMARMLLLGVFDIETLLKSNLRGGKSKNVSPGETKEPLDRIKIDAIMNAVIQKFPGTTRGQLGVAINQKVTELRKSQKTCT
ncbi:uncharacterized protein LOC117594702 isoform X2 [Esox lucius]|uniref:uncharacterized protein LOC117594702 isoform X2 n=1 Tax=Esox lucius TaxID=8010 RepID=UPI0014768D66|nr:uncharacterized protein LOC117594702 isoform X2 [Esox lucius]